MLLFFFFFLGKCEFRCFFGVGCVAINFAPIALIFALLL
jgi:hypothetical protein